MIAALAALVTAAVSAWLLTPLAGRMASRAGVLDRPDRGRKRHRRLVPLWGGLPVLPALVLGLVAALGCTAGGANLWHYRGGWLGGRLGWLAAAAALLTAAGLRDDLRPLPPKVKLALQLVAAGLAVGAGLRLEEFMAPGSTTVWVLAAPAGMALALLWLVFFLNAYNFIDGLDGLASGQAVIAGLALAGAAVCLLPHTLDLTTRFQLRLAILLSLSTAGAACGFWMFNRHPARMFLGDAGSSLLGFGLGASALLLAGRATTPAAPWVPLLILGWPLADAVSVIVRRLRRGIPMSKADNRHLHHRLLELGFTPSAATAFIHAVALLLAMAGVVLAWL